jgi:hypothetical protein
MVPVRNDQAIETFSPEARHDAVLHEMRHAEIEHTCGRRTVHGGASHAAEDEGVDVGEER